MAAADNVDAGKDNTSIDSIVVPVERRALQIIERGLRMRKAGAFWSIFKNNKNDLELEELLCNKVEYYSNTGTTIWHTCSVCYSGIEYSLK